MVEDNETRARGDAGISQCTAATRGQGGAELPRYDAFNQLNDVFRVLRAPSPGMPCISNSNSKSHEQVEYGLCKNKLCLTSTLNGRGHNHVSQRAFTPGELDE